MIWPVLIGDFFLSIIHLHLDVQSLSIFRFCKLFLRKSYTNCSKICHTVQYNSRVDYKPPSHELGKVSKFDQRVSHQPIASRLNQRVKLCSALKVRLDTEPSHSKIIVGDVLSILLYK